jgi:hypothetical protein
MIHRSGDSTRADHALSSARPANMEEQFIHFMLKLRYVARELVVNFVDLHAHGNFFGRSRAEVEHHHAFAKLMPAPRRIFGDREFTIARAIVGFVIPHDRLQKWMAKC